MPDNEQLSPATTDEIEQALSFALLRRPQASACWRRTHGADHRRAARALPGAVGFRRNEAPAGEGAQRVAPEASTALSKYPGVILDRTA